MLMYPDTGTDGLSKDGRSPGGYSPPWGGWGLQGESLAGFGVCVGKKGGKQPPGGAGKSLVGRFPFWVGRREAPGWG